jgi:hypothetical protein
VASRAKLSRPRPESDAAGSFAAASRKPSISDLVPDFGVRTGAGQNSHNAGRGAMICLWKSFQIPVKPENLRSLGAMLPSLELNDGAVGDETKNQCLPIGGRALVCALIWRTRIIRAATRDLSCKLLPPSEDVCKSHQPQGRLYGELHRLYCGDQN